MNDLKKGDIIVAEGIREVVLARLEDLVFTQRLFETGARGNVSPATEIEDLITYGFELEGAK